MNATAPAFAGPDSGPAPAPSPPDAGDGAPTPLALAEQPQVRIGADAIQAWLALQCRMIPDVNRAAVFLGAIHDLTRTPSAGWPATLSQSGHLAAACRVAMQRGEAVVHGLSGSQSVVIASPLPHRGKTMGAVAVEVSERDEQRQQAVMRLLEWGGQWLEFSLPDEQGAAAPARLELAVEVIAACLQHEKFQAAASTVVNLLAGALDCTRVSLGVLERGHMRVRALSHTSHLHARSNLLRTIEAAMDEALDESAPVVYPPLASGALVAARAHEILLHEHERGSVCTVPLFVHGQALGAVTFERARGDAFDADAVARCDAALTLLAPLLDLKRRDDRFIGAKLLESVAGLLARLLGPRHLPGKLLALGLCAVIAFMALANGEFRVSATAVLEGSEHRALVAPVDGYIKTARTRAGDVVKRGQLLASLDTRALEIERRKRASERAELGNELRQAIGKLDLARVQILEAQVAKTQAQLSLLEEQLARTRIVAPFAGYVVSGDLSRSLGAPVERGEVLFEIAPLDEYRVALRVDESDLAHIAVGQHGQVALSSLPGAPFAFVVEQVVGVAEVEDGRNMFRVDARLEQTAAVLRPGMNGVARIAVAQRRLLWIWTRELLQRTRLWLWSHLP